MLKRLFGRRAQPEPEPHAPSPQERRITEGLAALREATAREVMTPRVDVEALAAPVKFLDVAAAVRRSGHSHFPVYEEDLDHLLGVLFVKDLFRLAAQPSGDDEPGEADQSEGGIAGSLDVTDRVRQPELVPETRSALEVLADLRLRRRGFAVVVDEHGGFSGVLTIKDLVSELVGELPDEFDRPTSPTVLRTGPGRFLVDGACAVSEVRLEIGAPLPDGEYVTLGGFLFDAFGRIPSAGEAIERDGWTYRVARMERRRVAKVAVQAPSASVSGGRGDRPPAGAGPSTDGK
ncbi:MAG: hemolysin [Acidimicrobiaceae bacterium]|nr:hemolysin [Acidimicrobiaceae bacterium]